MEKEEGEMSDDAMLVDDDDIIKQEPSETKDQDRTVLFKADKDGIVMETLEKIDAKKLEERANRFGLNLSGNRAVTQKQIDELYAKSGIVNGNERHFRFEAIHLYGIDGLTTRDIFEYLEDYKPVSLEKVDDVSCNVVCQDHIAAALALLVHSREIKNEQLNTVLAEKSDHHWREGMPHPKKDLILMRFATNGDKKIRTKRSKNKQNNESNDQSMDPISKNPWGDLCKSWGVYDHQEVFQRKLPKNDYEDEISEPTEPIPIKNKRLALRLGKRRQKSVDTEESDSDSEWKKKSKTPRMRMHADDEESKKPKKQLLKIKEEESDAYAPLSIEVVNSSSSYTPRETTKLSDKFKFTSQSHKLIVERNKERIHSRLGIKVEPEVRIDDGSSEGYSSDNSEHNIMSRVQKVGSSARGGSSVWARLDVAGAEKPQDKGQSDLRQILKSRVRKLPQTDDLRSKLSHAKKAALRIEIDNNYARN